MNPPAENHTSECSEISSIEEDNVFEPVEASGPLHSYTSGDFVVSAKMEAAENFVKAKVRKLNVKMLRYNSTHLSYAATNVKLQLYSSLLCL